MKKLGLVGAMLVAALPACGSTSDDAPSSGAAGSGAAGGSGGTAGAAGAGGTSGSAGSAPIPADPGALKCGNETCTVPGEVCCYESVSPGGTDHCAQRMDCKAPNRACDETADCANGEICCTGASVLPMGAVVNGFAGTFCVDASAPGNCLPQPGVGKSSVQACKANTDCSAGECVVEDCYGYPLMTCGGSVDCK